MQAQVAEDAIDGLVSFDDFVRVVAHYRTPPAETAVAEAAVERLFLGSTGGNGSGSALPPRPSTTPAVRTPVAA